MNQGAEGVARRRDRPGEGLDLRGERLGFPCRVDVIDRDVWGY
jgi:hypothetical protein